MHILCDSCYQQCSQDALHVCPIETYACQDEDVESRELPAEALLKREVKCWNEQSGCQTVMAASNILQHFQLACGRHSVSCPKCSATVPCSGVITHLKSGLCHSANASPSGCEPQSEIKNKKTVFTLLPGELEKQVSEIKEFITEIASSLGDRLNEISHGINCSKETLSQELADGAKQNREVLTHMKSEVNSSNQELQCLSARVDALNLSGYVTGIEKSLKDELAIVARGTEDSLKEITTAVEGARAEGNKTSQKALCKLRIIQRHVMLGVNNCEFFVEDVKTLEETALKDGWAAYMSDPVYLPGYCMSPGVYLKKHDESVKLHVGLALYQGYLDDFLPWPFEHKIKLRVMHPEDGVDRVSAVKNHRSEWFVQKPKESTKEPGYYHPSPLDVTRPIADGCVEDDQLRVRWEVLL